MSLLANYASQKEAKGNALLIGAEARAAKAKDSSVIDSTIGMLFDEEGKFFTFKTVEKVVQELNGREKYSYGSTGGSNEYHEALYSWIFRQYLDEFKSSCYLRCIATPGGTGAVADAIANYLNPSDKVLLPNYMWTNYIQIANERQCGYEKYNMFDEYGSFDLTDFEAKANEIKRNQGRVVVIINDPCQNPTGYSMSYSDWIGVVQIINSISRDGTPVVLIYDMAYIDYDKRGFDASRNNIRLFKQFNDSVLTIMCFSGSKTLGLYGLRVGAEICIAKTKEDADQFLTASDFTARGIWSGTSTMGQNIITRALTVYKDEFANELEYARKLLIDRAEAFISEAKAVNLKHLPYSCGFFVTIPCTSPQELFEKLKEKGLYLLPIQNAVRLTLSSITLEEVKRAVHIIKETI